MVKSMTGIGRGKESFAGGYIRVEIKTFNHKFFELSYRLPENLQAFDEKIKKIIRARVKRGKVYLGVNYEKCTDNCLNIVVDEKRLKRYHKLLLNIKRKFNIADEITLAQLLSFPEVIIYKPQKENKALVWRATNSAFKKALVSLIKMRQREGYALYKDLVFRANNINRALKKIKTYIPHQKHKYERMLKSKLNNGLEKNVTRTEKLRTEIALFAKNSDVSEELTRLRSHVDNFKDMLKTNKETGKVLDFIAQEIHREINTVGAKSSDFKISKEVIYIKGETEKIREQVQNIE